MKKTGMAICLAALMAMGGTAYARNCNEYQSAPPFVAGGNGMGHEGPGMGKNIDPEKRMAFMEATRELRITMAGKRAEFEALMSQENPDAKRARELGEEMARARLTIAEKAREMGIAGFRGMGPKGRRGGQGCQRSFKQ